MTKPQQIHRGKNLKKKTKNSALWETSSSNWRLNCHTIASAVNTSASSPVGTTWVWVRPRGSVSPPCLQCGSKYHDWSRDNFISIGACGWPFPKESPWRPFTILTMLPLLFKKSLWNWLLELFWILSVELGKDQPWGSSYDSTGKERDEGRKTGEMFMQESKKRRWGWGQWRQEAGFKRLCVGGIEKCQDVEAKMALVSHLWQGLWRYFCQRWRGELILEKRWSVCFWWHYQAGIGPGGQGGGRY